MGRDETVDAVGEQVAFGVFGYFAPSAPEWSSPAGVGLLLGLLVAVVLVLPAGQPIFYSFACTACTV